MGSSVNGGRGVAGGILSLAVVSGCIYLRVMRAQDRAERRHDEQAMFNADHKKWKGRALEMMRQAPDAKGIGDYLAWGVETYNQAADDEAMADDSDGETYRDILITKIYDRARQDGREDVTRSLDKVRTMAKLADPDTWWIIQKQK